MELVNDWPDVEPDVLYSGLPTSLVKSLRASGWTRPDHLANSIDSRQDAEDILRQLDNFCETDLSLKSWADALWKWMGLNGEKLIRRSRLRFSNLDVADRVECLLKVNQPSCTTRPVLVSSCVFTKQCKWKTRRAAKQAQVASLQDRAKVEAEEKARWTELIIALLIESDLPVCHQAQLSSNPGLALNRVTGKKRSKTLRARYRTWKKIRLWLQCVHGVAWPTDIGQMIDYINDLEASNCARTVPVSVGCALTFFERISGLPDALCISTMVFWQQSLNAVICQVAESLGTVPVNKAPQPAVAMILSLELYVCSGRSRFKRFLAYCRLLKIWMILRFDDLQSLCSTRLTLSKFNLKSFVGRTKTTGPGKRLPELPCYVHAQASLTGLPWIEVGFELLKTDGFKLGKRDYFIGIPADDWDSMLPKMLDYSYCSALGRQLLGELKRPFRGLGGDWIEGDEVLLPHPGPLFFREHSDRHWAVSVAAALGNCTKEERDDAGRWGVSGKQSGEYALTSRHVVLGLQTKVLRAICEGPCAYDESDLFESYKVWLLERDPFYDAQRNLRLLSLDHCGAQDACLRQPWPVGRSGITVAVADNKIVKEAAAEEMFDDKVLDEDQPLWASIGKTGFTRLHRLEGCKTKRETCYRWKGLSWKEAEKDKSDKMCLLCWPELKDNVEATSSSDDSSNEGSESSSSEEEINESASPLGDVPAEPADGQEPQDVPGDEIPDLDDES